MPPPEVPQMPELLLEIGCEELPASACREALRQAPKLVKDALDALEIPGGEPAVLVAPRRIAVRVDDVPAARPASRKVHVGPVEQAAFGDDGVPTKAAEGFARSRGVSVDQLGVEERGGRRVVVAVVDEPEAPSAELVPEVATRLIDGLKFGKSMRWGDGGGLRFSRPVRWLVAMMDDHAIPFELHGLVAGPETQGHRFLGGPVRLASSGEYANRLREVGVIADQDERRSAIVEGLDSAARALGCSWSDPGGKLDEVVYLAEWPNVVNGAFDVKHLRLPPGVLVTAMQSHQRYFPLEEADGTLHAGFLAVSNGDPVHAALIARGNEDVLDARLQDAAFSFDRDRQSGLAGLNERLSDIVFHARLGSMADKRDRLVRVAPAIARAAGLGKDVLADVESAARLAKADQAAILVAEFAELEGYVGSEYARLEGASAGAWRAIAEQYLPTGLRTGLPQTDAGAALAAADKLDGVVGAFLAGEGPTGSRDPYGVRRSASGVIRIVLDRGWDIDLAPVVEEIITAFDEQGADAASSGTELRSSIEQFLADRLAFQLREEGVGAEAAAAAIGASVGGPFATASWARQLDENREGEAFRSVWTGAQRCARLAENKAPDSGREPVGPAEAALANAARDAGVEIETARRARDLRAAIAAGVPLAEAIDRFLTDVLVNAEDPEVRERRLGLVSTAGHVLSGVADFDELTDGGS
jgi:glycyl-tRNA synthetase beta chain